MTGPRNLVDKEEIIKEFLAENFSKKRKVHCDVGLVGQAVYLLIHGSCDPLIPAPDSPPLIH